MLNKYSIFKCRILEISFLHVCFHVAAELGDFESQHLPPAYVSEFQFVHDQTEDLEADIAHKHQKLGYAILLSPPNLYCPNIMTLTIVELFN